MIEVLLEHVADTINTPVIPVSLNLSVCTFRKDPSLIEVLLEHGADTTHLYDHGLTAAHMAVVKNQPVIIKALARHGADMNAKVTMMMTTTTTMVSSSSSS